MSRMTQEEVYELYEGGYDGTVKAVEESYDRGYADGKAPPPYTGGQPMNWTQVNILLKIQRKYGKRILKVSDVTMYGNPNDPDKVSVTYTIGQDDKALIKTRTFTLDEQGELKEVE